MILKINISKNTFEKNLVKLGYNYKIIQYEDFIKSIQNHAYKEVMKDLTEQTIKKVFGSYENILISNIVNPENIKNINTTYLVELIEGGLLDSFLEEKKIRPFSKTVMKDAFILKTINNLRFDNNLKNSSILNFQYYNYSYSYLFRNKSSTRYISAIKCLNLNMIELTEDEENEITEYIKSSLEKKIFNSARKEWQQLLPTLENYFYIENNSSPSNYTSNINAFMEAIREKIFERNILNEIITEITSFKLIGDKLTVFHNGERINIDLKKLLK